MLPKKRNVKDQDCRILQKTKSELGMFSSSSVSFGLPRLQDTAPLRELG